MNESVSQEVPAGVESAGDRLERAHALVRSYLPWSAGAGVLPVPVVDMIAFEAVQVHMIRKLAELYDTPFKAHGVKAVVTSLLGTSYSTMAGGAMAALMKFVPVVGPIASLTMVPGAYAAATWAMGRVFITHFESGGTLMNFDMNSMREFFVSEFSLARGKGRPLAQPPQDATEQGAPSTQALAT